MDTLAQQVVLPEPYASLPYLAELYGCVDWTVRAVYTAYLGWFYGNPTNLHPLPGRERAERSLCLMGGPDRVLAEAQRAYESGEFQWCLELCDLLWYAREREARALKGKALKSIAELETSANGRHYYLACAHELEQK